MSPDDQATRPRLAGVDLNLLVALDALLAEASVTRAARRVGLSQPAMSHALARLRALMGDRLFVRAGRRMALTPRAKALAEPLAAALAALERAAFDAPSFEPRLARRTIHVAAIDFAQLVVLPPLCVAMAREAPGVELVIIPPKEPIDRMLAEGEVDIALGLARDAPTLNQRELLRERFVTIVRRGHPATRRRLTARRFADLRHAIVSPRGRVQGSVDAALAAQGLARNVVLTVPSFHAAALVVARSDVVLTVSERVAMTALGGGTLRILKPPVALDPFVVTMMWHARLDGDPLHAWLRERLVGVARAL